MSQDSSEDGKKHHRDLNPYRRRRWTYEHGVHEDDKHCGKAKKGKNDLAHFSHDCLIMFGMTFDFKQNREYLAKIESARKAAWNAAAMKVVQCH